MENKLIYYKSATEWNDALPIGNGRIGGMVWGKETVETVSLNEDTLWYGTHKDRNNKEGIKHLHTIRDLLSKGNEPQAEKLCYTALTSIPKYFGAYQPLGDLNIWFGHSKKVKGYKRELDLSNAVATVGYNVDGAIITREYFVSHKDNVMVIKISADKPLLNFWCNLMRRPFDGGTEKVNEKTIAMSGRCGENGVRFECLLSGETDGDIDVTGDFLSFENASEVVLYLTANSNFNNTDPHAASYMQIERAKEKGFEELKRRHIDDYQDLYGRIELSLDQEDCNLPTDKRIEQLRDGKMDSGLVELYYNFGRYLMISASRRGTQAMNLQGIWNNSFTPSWECNYTININTQMNYWAANVCNLSECNEPLFDLIDRMMENGKITAQAMYGCNGFVAHHCTNIWGDTAIEGISFPSSVWPMGGAWLALHLFEHYKFMGDIDFLSHRAYPILKQAAIFFVEYMLEDADGYLVTGPSISPENRYIRSDGAEGSLCMGPAIDNQIVKALFESVIQTCDILGKDNEFVQDLKKHIKKIKPPMTNYYGGIMEWDQDYVEANPGHRHISHLFALYPYHSINYKNSQELMKACEITLKHKEQYSDPKHIGWSSAWKASLYARLMNGDKAVYFLKKMISTTSSISLLNIYPPFQIDGNLGAVAAVNEMLIQSHMDEILILPALPKEWSNGYVKGLCARGGFVIDIYWKDNRPYKVKILSRLGGDCKIKFSDSEKSFFNTEIGGKYTVEYI